MRKILIIGATSAIAQAFARHSIQKGDALFLVGRDESKLASVVEDLKSRSGQRIGTFVADATAYDTHESLIRTAAQELGGIDVMVIAHGILGDQRAEERDFTQAELAYRTNFLSVVSLTTQAALFFEKQEKGTIAVISSVAGDRGRQSNYIYGSAKGALSLYLAGLRNRLYRNGIGVLTIKPGFVATPMTAHLKKGFLFASPEKVASDIYRAIEKNRDILYTPGIWFWIMLAIRLIPERIFKRMKL
jgi:short-subunit dehydrogenase